MANVSNAVFIIQHYGKMEANVRLAIDLAALATENHFLINEIPESMSVARSKREFKNTINPDWKWFVNLDDDLITHYNAWYSLLNRSGGLDVHTIGVVDAANVRGYSDFNRTRYLSYASYLNAGMPEDKAKVHFIKSLSTIQYKWLSQFYSMRRDVLEDDNLWLLIEETFSKKGVRGYDIALEIRLTELGYKIGYTMGCEAHHIGLEQGYLNDNWKATDAVVSQRVTLNV
jgi:hypothetical protein